MQNILLIQNFVSQSEIGLEIVGILVVNHEREGFLHYIQPFSGGKIVYDLFQYELDNLYEQAMEFCKPFNIKLVKY